MKCINSFFKAALFLALTSPAFAAEDSVEDAGGWMITTRTVDAQKIQPLCILLSPESETRIQLVNALREGDTGGSARGAARFDIILSEALVQEQNVSLSDVVLTIDGQRRWQSTGATWRKTGESSGIISGFADDAIDNVIPPLVKGSALKIEVSIDDQPSKEFSVDLAGSSKALRVYERCLEKVRVSS